MMAAKLRSKTFERIVDGTPNTVFDEGKWLPEEMRCLRIKRADVRTAASLVERRLESSAEALPLLVPVG